MQETAVAGVSRMLLGGDFVDSASGETIAVQNPANRGIFAHVPRAGRRGRRSGGAGRGRRVRGLARRAAA